MAAANTKCRILGSAQTQVRVAKDMAV